ncbi:MAG: shikimate dehydrogenase [Anaerolineales bacterium]
MIHLGLIGFPLEHSLSPKIHSAALASCGLAGDYSLFPIYPDDLSGLKNLLARVRSGEITGLNVTIPHKQNVIPLLDGLTSTARAIGAVNTIYLNQNKLIGDNTDAQGFLFDSKRFMGDREFGIENRTALVLGAGGSSRAVVYALVNDGWNVTVAARRIEQAQELAPRFESIKAVELNSQTFQSLFPQLIVNATPLGMTPNVDQSPWPKSLPFPPQAVAYDLVYNPRETKLVKDARAAGLCATSGLGMLVEQAALAFEIWTGKRIPRDILFSAVEEK